MYTTEMLEMDKEELELMRDIAKSLERIANVLEYPLRIHTDYPTVHITGYGEEFSNV